MRDRFEYSNDHQGKIVDTGLSSRCFQIWSRNENGRIVGWELVRIWLRMIGWGGIWFWKGRVRGQDWVEDG